MPIIDPAPLIVEHACQTIASAIWVLNSFGMKLNLNCSKTEGMVSFNGVGTKKAQEAFAKADFQVPY